MTIGTLETYTAVSRELVMNHTLDYKGCTVYRVIQMILGVYANMESDWVLYSALGS